MPVVSYVDLYDSTFGLAQWEVQQSGGGYTIRNVATGKYLSANGTRDGTDVKASSNPTTWDIREEGNSYA